jgi:hypothetical protein
MRRIALALLSAVTIAGCGLISSDVLETPFALPPRMYSFDSGAFPVPAGITGEVPCGAAPVVNCCSPDDPLPKPDCSVTTLTCEPNENGMSVCTATVKVAQSQTMNLGQEVSELSGLSGVVNIKIKRISYDITANTLNLALPDIILYLGPEGAMTPDDAGVMRFGTLPAIAAMETRSGDVVLDRNASGVLKTFTSNIQAPFTFIAATTVKATHSPAGRIDLRISGELALSP